MLQNLFKKFSGNFKQFCELYHAIYDFCIPLSFFILENGDVIY